MARSEVQLVQTIRAFRDAGVPVKSIKDILKNQSSVSVQLLEQRLFDLNSEMRNLKEQQILLARLLAQATLGAPGKVKNKEALVALTRAAGLSEDDEAHKKFLESLKLPAREVEAIRAWAIGP
jgi:DNA-binding transcriptional MerR regulator